jgi:hypothetical protein
MKSRLLWAVVVVVAIAGIYLALIRRTGPAAPGFSRQRPTPRELQPAEAARPTLPPLVMASPTLPPPPLSREFAAPPVAVRRAAEPMEVPIQDNTTIDFSIGAPVVRSQTKDQEALDRALREMAEAAKGVTFPPGSPKP